MAEENLQLPSEQSLDYHIVTLFHRLESMRKDTTTRGGGAAIGINLSMIKTKQSMQMELLTLEFWRYVKYLCIKVYKC